MLFVSILLSRELSLWEGKSHQGRTVMTWPRRTLAIFLLAQGSFFLETLEGKGLGLGSVALVWKEI